MKLQSVADIMGPWSDSDFDSSLIERCKRFWDVPVGNIPNEILSTFLRQRIALDLIVPEAERRIKAGIHDNSELFEGELIEALKGARP
jgi:hypothetical protein